MTTLAFIYINILWIALIVLGLFGIFVLIYILNRKTKKPDNCPKLDISCQGCMMTCSSRDEQFNPISLITGKKIIDAKDDSSIVPIEEVKPLKKKVLLEEQKSFIEELEKEGYFNKKGDK